MSQSKLFYKSATCTTNHTSYFLFIKQELIYLEKVFSKLVSSVFIKNINLSRSLFEVKFCLSQINKKCITYILPIFILFFTVYFDIVLLEYTSSTTTTSTAAYEGLLILLN